MESNKSCFDVINPVRQMTKDRTIKMAYFGRDVHASKRKGCDLPDCALKDSICVSKRTPECRLLSRIAFQTLRIGELEV